MRISDWSSDVCSSDLPRATNAGACDPGLPLSREHMGGNTSLFRPEAAENAVEILHGDIDMFHARADIDDAVGGLGLGAAELAVDGLAGAVRPHAVLVFSVSSLREDEAVEAGLGPLFT